MSKSEIAFLLFIVAVCFMLAAVNDAAAWEMTSQILEARN